jgi:hypothetical protein
MPLSSPYSVAVQRVLLDLASCYIAGHPWRQTMSFELERLDELRGGDLPSGIAALLRPRSQGVGSVVAAGATGILQSLAQGVSGAL